MIPKKRTPVSETIMRCNELERDADSKKRHFALRPAAGGGDAESLAMSALCRMPARAHGRTTIQSPRSHEGGTAFRRACNAFARPAAGQDYRRGEKGGNVPLRAQPSRRPWSRPY